ncbi:sensory neuron membrane protein 1 isoform X2 [Nomia melanderi]|uniref:sensory neuron membrane protein 1 isoform X2 n=1 Tax=Nomia melanderi TaxID=2448451 RepID=UPI003FCD4325
MSLRRDDKNREPQSFVATIRRLTGLDRRTAKECSPLIAAFQRVRNLLKMMSKMKPKKLMIIGGSMFGFGFIVLMIIFPPIVKMQIKRQVSLRHGTEMRDLWTDFPLPLDFKIHLFNVTNPNEIMAGQKPIVHEVGPFFYDEYKQKVDQVDRDEDDSIEYRVKTTWYFNPARSNGLTGEEEIVFPNILILSMVKMVLAEQPSAMGLINKGVDSIFKKPQTVFVKAKVRDILFDGLFVDCRVKDFAGTAICSQLKEKGESLVPLDDDQYLFSLFGKKNGSVDPATIRVLRGIKNYRDTGRVIEFNGEPMLSIWADDRCNQFNGTDSTIFPPLMTEQDDIVSFSPEICRSLSAPFQYKSKVKGVNTYHYEGNFGDMKTNPLDKCYCPTPETCFDKDLLDLNKCVGAPLVGSQPHFLGTEEKYLQLVGGLNPNKEDHDLSMDFEPMTATPLSAHKRLQFNMFLSKVEKFKLMKNFPECLFPFFWVDEGILLGDEFVKKLKVVFALLTVVKVLKYITIFGGIITMGMGGFMMYKEKDKNSMDVTKVTPEMRNGKDDEKKWPTQVNVSTIQTQSAAVPPNLDMN